VRGSQARLFESRPFDVDYNESLLDSLSSLDLGLPLETPSSVPIGYIRVARSCRECSLRNRYNCVVTLLASMSSSKPLVLRIAHAIGRDRISINEQDSIAKLKQAVSAIQRRYDAQPLYSARSIFAPRQVQTQIVSAIRENVSELCTV